MSRVPALADELQSAYLARRRDVVPPSSRDGGLDLDTAYAVERELSARRRATGHTAVGRKVGYANKAVWRALKLETLVWADMYDDTVQFAPSGSAELSIAGMCAPKIEPEIVFQMRRALEPGVSDPVAILNAVEWVALGFEIIDCPYADWKFQPPDFVAAYGLHAALVVGPPTTVDAGNVAALVAQLPSFKVRLSKNGELVEEGTGRNSLRSPALCLGELATAISHRAGAEPLAAGELVSSGTLTESKLIVPGETWSATLDGLDLAALSLHVSARD